MVKFGRIAKTRDEVIEYSLSRCPARLVLGGIVSKPGEMIDYYQDVLIPFSTGFKVQVINTNKLYGRV